MMSATGKSRKPSRLMFSVVCNEYRYEIALPIPFWVQRPLFRLLAGVGRPKYGWILKDVGEWPAEYGGPEGSGSNAQRWHPAVVPRWGRSPGHYALPTTLSLPEPSRLAPTTSSPNRPWRE